jgi:hypothetical protein
MQYRRIAAGVGAGALLAGTAGILAQVDGVHKLGIATMLFVVGVMILGWSGLAQAFHGVTRPADDAYHLGFQIGFDRGYVEGRQTARPVVVPMVRASTCLHSEECDRQQSP